VIKIVVGWATMTAHATAYCDTCWQYARWHIFHKSKCIS
jgi:hypothetical protein